MLTPDNSGVLEVPVRNIPKVIVAQTTDATVLFYPQVNADLDDMTAARQALLSFMEGQSEERWAASWLGGLQFALLGDPGYEWLVDQCGGWWEWARPEEGGDKDWRKFVPGTLDVLKTSAKHA